MIVESNIFYRIHRISIQLNSISRFWKHKLKNITTKCDHFSTTISITFYDTRWVKINAIVLRKNISNTMRKNIIFSKTIFKHVMSVWSTIISNSKIFDKNKLFVLFSTFHLFVTQRTKCITKNNIVIKSINSKLTILQNFVHIVD